MLLIRSDVNENYREAIDFKYKQNNVVNGFCLNLNAVDCVPSYYDESGDGTIILTTYWSDPKTGFNVLCDAVSEVFKAPIEAVIMVLDRISVEICQSSIDWTEKQFPTVPVFQIKGRCSFENYFWLVRNTRARNKVFFMMEPTEYPENHENVNLEMEEVTIEHGRWMKLQEIHAIKANKILIKDVTLADNEINLLLKNLKASKEKSHLKNLVLGFFRGADAEVVLEGLDVTNEDQMKPEDSLNQWSFRLESGQKCTIFYSKYG